MGRVPAGDDKLLVNFVSNSLLSTLVAFDAGCDWGARPNTEDAAVKRRRNPTLRVADSSARESFLPARITMVVDNTF